MMPQSVQMLPSQNVNNSDQHNDETKCQKYLKDEAMDEVIAMTHFSGVEQMRIGLRSVYRDMSCDDRYISTGNSRRYTPIGNDGRFCDIRDCSTQHVTCCRQNGCRSRIEDR